MRRCPSTSLMSTYEVATCGKACSDGVGLDVVSNDGGITPTVLADFTAQAVARAHMWRRISAATGTVMVVLDIDESLNQSYSENEAGTCPTYRAGSGSHRCCLSRTPPVKHRGHVAPRQRRRE